MAAEYNLVVIGAGAAGLVSSYLAAAVKAKVAVIERAAMGGDCLNTGCVPSKALIKTAKLAHQVRNHAKYGLKSASCEVDLGAVMERVQRIVRAVEPHDGVERYTGLGVDCIYGDAEILDAHTVKVSGRLLTTKSMVLALGASPIVPQLKGLEQVRYRTSATVWDMRVLPKRLVVIGGGPIGCEMTQALARLGAQVTQVEMGPRLLPREDADVAALIHERFVQEGVDVRCGAKATEVLVEGGLSWLVLETESGAQRVLFDEILFAVGRRANTRQTWDWAKLGIELDPSGTIKVDRFLRANGRNIYACGDAIQPYQFTHTAAHQAWYCAVNALFSPLKKFAADYRVIPWVTFTDPEVAQVGLTELSAQALGIPYTVTTYGIEDLDRAIAESEAFGQVKVLTPPGKDRILGANIVGMNAGEMIAEFVAAMQHGFGLNAILGTIHAYPTMVEANKYAAGNWKKAHAPHRVLRWVEKFHAWRR